MIERAEVTAKCLATGSARVVAVAPFAGVTSIAPIGLTLATPFLREAARAA
jgi:hypothetical protein